MKNYRNPGCVLARKAFALVARTGALFIYARVENNVEGRKVMQAITNSKKDTL
jgi:hypothetical protein